MTTEAGHLIQPIMWSYVVHIKNIHHKNLTFADANAKVSEVDLPIFLYRQEAC